MLAEVNHVGPRRSIIEQLRERGTGPDQIDTVVFRYETNAGQRNARVLIESKATPIGTTPVQSAKNFQMRQLISGQGRRRVVRLDTLLNPICSGMGVSSTLKKRLKDGKSLTGPGYNLVRLKRPWISLETEHFG